MNKKRLDVQNDEDESVMIEIPFEYQIVHGNEAVITCLNLREDQNITPIIMGGYNNIKRFFGYEADESPESIIEKSKQFDINHFVSSRIEVEPELYSDMIGEWPKNEVEKIRLIAHTEILSGNPLKKVYICLFPTNKSFEVPAYLNFGNSNDCASPEEHVGILRYWYEKYGAKIISITSDTIECTVERPPTTKEDALALANEQFVYCPDIVTQGTGGIKELAAALIDSEYWYFWWD